MKYYLVDFISSGVFGRIPTRYIEASSKMIAGFVFFDVVSEIGDDTIRLLNIHEIPEIPKESMYYDQNGVLNTAE